MTDDNKPFDPSADATAGSHAGTPDSAASPGASVPPDTETPAPAARTRWIVAAAGALGVALFAVPFLRAPDPLSTSASVVPVGTASCSAAKGAANLDFTLKDASGVDVRLSDYKGKVILLNFWATWCGPCKVEIPDFVEVYAEYRDRGVEILGVLSQDDPPAADLQAFMTRYKMNYPVFRSNESFEDAVGPIWALPTTYIIDRNGSICLKHMGAVPKEVVEREIKGLL